MNEIIKENPSLRLYDFDRVFNTQNLCVFPQKYHAKRTTKIKNQGNIGACVGCALATIGEYLFNKEMSEGWNYGQFRKSNDKSYGLAIVTALDYWKNLGEVPLADFGILKETPDIINITNQYPELKEIASKYRIGGYASLNYADKNKRDLSIKQALSTNNIALIGISRNYFGESHAIVIDGWNDENNTYTFQNSWGREYGTNGYAEIPKDKLSDVYAVFLNEFKFPFKDVSEDRWSYKSIKNVYLSGLMKGTSEDTFEPEKPLTREEMAVIIDRLCKLTDDRLERIYDIINEVQ